MTTTEYELLRHDYEKVLENPQSVARLKAAVDWVM